MKPILFKRNETQFNSNGVGRMSDAISCTIEESRNGVYELEMVYPIDGIHFKELALEMLIYARHSDATDMQAFRIYRITKPLNGKVTVNARHISYDLSKITVSPFTASTIGEAFQLFPAHALNDCPFTFTTDKTTVGNFHVDVPSSIRSVLGGVEGSILDVYGGGEYEWDMYAVKLHTARGTNAGVTIRYGKNLTDLEHTNDSEDQYTGVAPYWANDTTTVTLPEGAIYSEDASRYYDAYTNQYGAIYTNQNGTEYNGYMYDVKVVPLDMSSNFETAPTVAQLRAAAQSFLSSTGNTVPDENIEISFVQLWQTNEYKNVAPLQRVKLCDTVNVIYTKLGVKVSAKVIRTVYNVLLERYDEMELGDPKRSLASTLASQVTEINSIRKLAEGSSVTMSDVAAAIQSNSEKITGALGGYVILDANTSTGYPERILVMDQPDTASAQNVIQINSAGIGFSQNGINGPYNTAWTIDGNFTASFINTWSLSASQITGGTMSGDLIKGGTLKVGGTVNGAGGNGILAIYNSSNTQVGTWDVNGLSVGSNFSVDMAGDITANSATLTNADVSGTITTGALTATGGRIARFTIGATQMYCENPVTEGTASTRYNITLTTPANPANTDVAFQIRERAYDGSSFGAWVPHVVMRYDGLTRFIDTGRTANCIVNNAYVQGTVKRELRFTNGRIFGFRNETVNGTETQYFTGVIDQGVTAGTSPAVTRAIALMCYPSNKVGLGVIASSAATSAGKLVFYYDGTENTAGTTASDMETRGVLSCMRPLWMNEYPIVRAGNITSIGTVQGTEFLQSGGSVTAYCVTGRTKQVDGVNAFYQIAYQNSYTFFFLNGSQIASIAPSTSDRRKKKDIKPINEELLDRVDGVELKQFKFKKATGLGDYTHYGAIAQDVQEAIGDENANIVYTSPDSEDLNLNYTEFLILKIAALEKRIKALEGGTHG